MGRKNRAARRTPAQAAADRQSDELAARLRLMLRDARQQRRVTQREASEIAGLSPSTWSWLEIGRDGRVTLATVNRAASAVDRREIAGRPRASRSDRQAGLRCRRGRAARIPWLQRRGTRGPQRPERGRGDAARGRRGARRPPSAACRAVLDTNVLVSALISPSGASEQLLIELRTGGFELIISPLLLAELRDMLSRPKFRRYVSEAEIDAYADLIRRESLVVDDPLPSSEPVGGDPDDEYLIDLARAEQVDAFVTGDARLLVLRDLLPVRTPREFIDSLATP